jgi:polyisoprenoid-binding protein YceI
MSTTEIKERQAGIVPAGVWAIDPSHSSIGFSVKHMMIATVRGRFAQFEGAVEADETGIARVHGVVEAATIDTNEPQRDEHLRSADFLDAAEHPQIRFASSAIERLGGDEYRILGEITIRGVTREIALDTDVQGAGTDPWGNERIALEASGELSRKDFGLTWNQVTEAGGVLVGDKIRLTLDLSTVRTEGV